MSYRILKHKFFHAILFYTFLVLRIEILCIHLTVDVIMVKSLSNGGFLALKAVNMIFYLKWRFRTWRSEVEMAMKYISSCFSLEV